jgi:glycolate oxidase FAD binding subunit
MGVALDTALPPGLAASLHPGQVRRGRAADAVDGVGSAFVLTARNEDDVVRVVDEARKAKLALVAVGGATRLHMGNIATAIDLRLSLGGTATIVEHSPQDMVVTAEAGVSLSRLNHALAKHGQRICIDEQADDRATIGGIAASNSTGGFAYGFGTPRDLVLGMTVVDGKARLLRAGGKVVKNVSGYDLVRLFTGSYGSLGIITSVTLRTHPIPEHVRCLTIEFETVSELEALRAHLFASHLPLTCFDFGYDVDNARWRVVLRLEGTKNEVEYQKGRIEQAAGRSSNHHDGESPFHPSGQPTVTIRIAAAPAKCLAVADAIAREVSSGRSDVTLGGRLGDGIMRVSAGEEDLRRALNFVRTVTDTAKAIGAAVVIERAPAEIKRIFDVWGDRPGGFALMRRAKQTFDPDGILSPGRFVGGL